jgi:hypothetical protein
MYVGIIWLKIRTRARQFVCLKVCEICLLFKDLFSLQELRWPMNLITYYIKADVHVFIATSIYVYLLPVMEWSAVTFSPSHCLIHTT